MELILAGLGILVSIVAILIPYYQSRINLKIKIDLLKFTANQRGEYQDLKLSASITNNSKIPVLITKMHLEVKPDAIVTRNSPRDTNLNGFDQLQTGLKFPYALSIINNFLVNITEPEMANALVKKQIRLVVTDQKDKQHCSNTYTFDPESRQHKIFLRLLDADGNEEPYHH